MKKDRAEQDLNKLPVEELYAIARKKGLAIDDSMSKEDLLMFIEGSNEEAEKKPPVENEFMSRSHSVRHG